MKRSNSYLSMIIAIIITAGCFWYSWAVLVPGVKSQTAALAQAESNTSSARSYLDELTQSKSSIEELGELPSLLSLAIPGDKDAPDLVTELEAVAAKDKLIIPSIQATDSTSEEAGAVSAANTVKVNFTVQGGFAEISTFISDLESDVRYMNIQSVTMTSIQNDSGANTGSLSLSLQLEAYKRSGPVASASVDTTSTGGE